MAGLGEIPFYDRDGRHWMTVEIELDDSGEPPPLVQLAGSEAGRQIQCRFRREHRPGSAPPWAYVEVDRAPRVEPPPGSPEALRRVLDSEQWPL